MLAKRTAASISKNLLLNIVDALQATRPPPTPLDALLTDEEKFERINPGVSHIAHAQGQHTKGHASVSDRAQFQVMWLLFTHNWAIFSV